jgi:hypothetical protein
VTPNTDLYAINAAARLDPGTARASYADPLQPLRNGDLANLGLNLLGLGPVPGSTLNRRQDLTWQGSAAPPAIIAHTVFNEAPGVRPTGPLTRAYDLMYAAGPGGEHTMTLAGEGRNPGRSHMLRLAEQADVSVREAESIIGEVRDAVAQWADFAEQAGVSDATRNQIARSLSGRGA